MSEPKKNRAQAAYEAYCAAMHQDSDWDALPSNTKDAWWDAVLSSDDAKDETAKEMP